MNNDFIDVLRNTQELLDERMDEMNVLTGLVSLMSLSLSEESFYYEFSELIISRLQVKELVFYKYENGKLLPLWKRSSDDSDIVKNDIAQDKNAQISLAKDEMIEISFESGLTGIYIPLVFAGEKYGSMMLGIDNDDSFSFFKKPFFLVLGTLTAAIIKVMNQQKKLENEKEILSKQNEMLRDMIIGAGEGEERLIFTSSAMAEIVLRFDKIKNLDVDVLLTGESGTGKDMAAKYLHYSSKRKDAPFVAVNCAAIPESLVEGELFGIEDGVATGVTGRKGKFEYADKGTLFLDEIGELSLSVQAKLLRFMQDKKITKVGSDKEITVDVRIIAATNRNFDMIIKNGTFRNDLFYRLSNFPIEIPPLRERKEDIIPLISHFLGVFSKRYAKKGITITEQLAATAESYSWPGNIRELKNRVLQAVIMSDDNQRLFPESLNLREIPIPVNKKEYFNQYNSVDTDNLPSIQTADLAGWMNNQQKMLEKKAILEALRRSEGIKKDAAEILGISRRSFYYKIKELGIE